MSKTSIKNLKRERRKHTMRKIRTILVFTLILVFWKTAPGWVNSFVKILLTINIINIVVYVLIMWSKINTENKRIKVEKQKQEKRRAQEASDAWDRTYQRYEYHRKSQQQNHYNQNGRSYSNSNYGSSLPKTIDKLGNAAKLMKIDLKTNTDKEIKKRYRTLAIKWHPDKWSTEPQSRQDTAKRNFQKLNAAYELIKEHKKIV